MGSARPTRRRTESSWRAPGRSTRRGSALLLTALLPRGVAYDSALPLLSDLPPSRPFLMRQPAVPPASTMTLAQRDDWEWTSAGEKTTASFRKMGASGCSCPYCPPQTRPGKGRGSSGRADATRSGGSDRGEPDRSSPAAAVKLKVVRQVCSTQTRIPHWESWCRQDSTGMIRRPPMAAQRRRSRQRSGYPR